MGSHRGLNPLDAYLKAQRDLVARGADPGAIVRSVALGLLRDRRVVPPERFVAVVDAASLPLAELPPAELPAAELRTPWLLGQLHETLMDSSARRRAGAHYTPPDVARSLVAFAREGHDVDSPVVCDPAVGGGAFLLAAAESLSVDGIEPAAIVRRHVHGSDIDPVAVDVARAALALWAGEWPDELDEHVVVADALRSTPRHLPVDLVVGNPPFQNQLGAGTARGQAGTDELRDRFGRAAKGYVDNAALFLLVGLDLVNEGGRVALVQPHSTIAARDAEGVRAALLERGHLVGVWFTDERVFSAGVRVWAPVIQRGRAVERAGGGSRAIRRRIRATFEPADDCTDTAVDADSWASLVADLTGVPAVRLRADGLVGDLATATAGFRDQYYGLVGAIREADGEQRAPRLVTSGLVEPLDVAWGRAPVRFAGRRWNRPVVQFDAVDPSIERWVQAQLVPKLLVATQTRVIEVAVDADGDLVPSTPVIAVHAAEDRLWRLAAALGAPPITALALRSSVGTALSAGAVKLSARQILALPLPADRDAWDEATDLARRVPLLGDASKKRAAMAAYGAVACTAYGVDPDPVLEWWLARLPG